ncbi:MAG: hypothetical protein IV107_18925 [Paucibacter sp.]|nr:hypothetical protein [Roseateles sp.]
MKLFFHKLTFQRRNILFATLMASCQISMAGTMVVGKIKEIQINKALGNVVFVQLDANHTTPISCQVNVGWTYTLPQQTDADRKIFALLSMALATGQTVRLYGSGACSDFAAVESISAAAIQQ